MDKKLSTRKDLKGAAQKAAPASLPNNGQIQVTAENSPLLMVKMLENVCNLLHKINMQLVEINYYVNYLEPEEKRSPENKKLVEHFAQRGIILSRKD